MTNFDDFDLDLKRVKGSVTPDSTLGPVCTFVSGVISGSVLTGCSADCVTRHCSEGCPVPSRDYAHHSCGNRVNMMGDQINC